MRFWITLLATVVLLSASAAPVVAEKLVLEDEFDDPITSGPIVTALPNEMKEFFEAGLLLTSYAEPIGLTRFVQILNGSSTVGTSSAAIDTTGGLLSFNHLGAPTGTTATGTLGYLLDQILDVSQYPRVNVKVLLSSQPAGLSQLVASLNDSNFNSASWDLAQDPNNPLLYLGGGLLSEQPAFDPSKTSLISLVGILLSRSDADVSIDSIQIFAVPEPGSHSLLLTGGLLLAVCWMVSRCRALTTSQSNSSRAS